MFECNAKCSRTCAPCDTCFTFDAPLALGTEYGASVGTPSGSVVLASNGIALAVNDFTFASGATHYGFASVTLSPAPFGTGQVLGSNNINLAFDFTGMPALPSEVRLEFLDLGGIENLSVNGAAPFVGSLATAPATLGGADVTVFTSSVSGGTSGVLLVRGAIKSLVIGGQEFWIDNVCAKP